jgi:isoamylase
MNSETPPPLGLRWNGGQAEIAVPVGPSASSVSSVSSVEVHVWGNDGANEPAVFELTQNLGQIWWGRPTGVSPGDQYGIRVTGEGHDPSKLLLDPWALAVAGTLDWSNPEALRLGSGIDSAPFVPRGVVVDERFDWGTSTRPQTPWSETVIYEVHVKGATMSHPDIDPKLRGTFAGLAQPAFIEHLKALGITAVELLPIHHSVSEQHLAGLGLTNYWGYNTLGFFAPDQRFSNNAGSAGSAVDECKTMIKALHEAGIEVILDVVYNHTAEAGAAGPTLSLRGLDPVDWYRDHDVTGCGNTLDLTQPMALRLVLDSLRYWVTEYQVDGFRFDLAAALARTEGGDFSRRSAFMMAVAADPVISSVKLIAEPWDVGPGGYQVGSFGAPWAEWNDRYRDLVRDHWRGEAPLGAFARRLAGGPDIFQATNRRPWSSINFVTAHDGFTLRDLVTYNEKHNEANGEANRDGTSNNRSWNHGDEGPTDDPVIAQARNRSIRAMLASLFMSQGTPMLLGGDEFGRTQHGNNNAYCQDNEISWFDWTSVDSELFAFTCALSNLRRARATLRQTTWLTSEQAHWFAPDGSPMDASRWDDWSAAGLTMLLHGVPANPGDPSSGDGVESDLCIALNDAPDPCAYVLPANGAGAWHQILTSAPEACTHPFDAEAREVALPERTVAVFEFVAALTD